MNTNIPQEFFLNASKETEVMDEIKVSGFEAEGHTFYIEKQG